MGLTNRQLNRATLDRQHLLERVDDPVPDVVRRIVALQAQEPPSPYVALWNRIAGFRPADLDEAFRGHQIVKATLMRVTLHAVHSADYPMFHRAMLSTLHGARFNDRRFRDTGVTQEEAELIAVRVAEFAAEARTKDEIEALVSEHVGSPEAASWVWWALRQAGAFWHAPSDDPWSFGRRPTYLAARSYELGDEEIEPIQIFFRRYLEGFGPASPNDLAQFALLRLSVIRPALEEMTGLVEMEGPDGRPLLDVEDGSIPDEDTPSPPRLMAMWDSTLLAFKDRSRIIPEEYRRQVIQRNGDVLPTVLVDGYVAGVWRPTDDGIEVTAFHRLDEEAWGGLDEEARLALSAFVERDPTLYRRYGRWWKDLTGAEVRVIGG